MRIIILILLFTQAAFAQLTYSPNQKERRIFFEGNSLSNLNNNSTAVGGHYVPLGIYANLVAAGKICAFNSYAISGQQQSQINSNISTKITPYAKPGDIIVLWEGTNDMGAGGLSSAAAWANVVTYITSIPQGVKLFICTVTARDFAGDPVDLMTRIDEYNALVRSNAATYGYIVIDYAANAAFDTKADASNTTYFKPDKIHFATGGQDLQISIASPIIISNF